ncbi:DDB1- and CUL4-associated factor 17-like [Liolophura sinensis]|uniref:DDB1- and CUL4-associated factor 17-like n=1 Tax=Liolophura sinensis TaxID=3198878 RepID=UPI0031598E68
MADSHKVHHAEDNEVNILLRGEPPILFELKCADHLIEIGGSPWHYLYSPPHQEGVFHVKHLETHTQAKNGILEFESFGLEPHRAIFHPDDSGRIIHIGDGTMKVYRIGCSGNKSPFVEESFTITARRSQPSTLLSFPQVTKSGRRVKKRVQHGYTESDTMHIEDVDYENELDVLCVTSVQHAETLKRPQVFTGFYHNWTGQLLKETVLEQPWESFYEHRVVVDLDTIVQTIKPSLGLFRCVVYRLVRAESVSTDTVNCGLQIGQGRKC